MEPGCSMSLVIPILSRIKFLVLTPISLRSILLLSSYLSLDLPTGLISVGLPVKILK